MSARPPHCVNLKMTAYYLYSQFFIIWYDSDWALVLTLGMQRYLACHFHWRHQWYGVIDTYRNLEENCPSALRLVMANTRWHKDMCMHIAAETCRTYFVVVVSIRNEAPLINRSSGGIQMGHNFYFINNWVAFCIGNPISSQNSQEVIYGKMSGISMGLMWACYRVLCPDGFVFITISWYSCGFKFFAGSALAFGILS